MTYEQDYARDVPAVTFADWQRSPNELRTDPVRILATIAACIDCAQEMAERGDIGADEIEDTARAIGYRIASRADRERRAVHTWFHGGQTSGETDAMPTAPDQYDRVKSDVRPKRSNSGKSTAIVGKHGRAYVTGSRTSRNGSTWTDRAIAHVIETAPQSTNGVDGIALSRIADWFYDLPRLIGADTVAFEESLHHGLRGADPHTARFPTRYGLPMVRRRSGDIGADHELLAPSADPEHVWIGHRHVLRSASAREIRATKRRAVDDAWNMDPSTGLAEQVGTLARIADLADGPYRATWQHGEMAGTLTRSGSGFRVTISGRPNPIKSRRADGIARAVARATS